MHQITGEDMSVSKRVGAIVAVVLTVSLLVMFGILRTTEESHAFVTIEDQIAQQKELLVKSITFAMGQGVTDVRPFIETVSKGKNLRDLRILPANIIKAGGEDKMDGAEKKVLSTKQAVVAEESFNGEPVIRSIEPVLADEGCIMCHAASVGTSLATVSMRYSLAEHQASLAGERILTIALGIATIIMIFFGVMVMINRQVLKDLGLTVQRVRGLAEGDVSQQLIVSRKDEIGALCESVRRLQESLQTKTHAAIEVSKGNLAIEVPLTSEKDGLGKALQQAIATLRSLVSETQTLTQAAIEGRLAVRGETGKFEGGYREIVAGINDTLDAVITPLHMAAHYFDRIANGEIPPEIAEAYEGDFNTIKNNLNKCIRAVQGLVEDATALSTAAEQGMLDFTTDAERHQGAFRRIVEGMNSTSSMFAGVLRRTIEHLENLGDGVVDEQVTRDYTGQFIRLKDGFNKSFDAINLLIADIRSLSAAAIKGNLSIRADATKHRGDFRKIVAGINNTLDAVINPLSAAAEYVDRISKGDIPPKITDDYHGDFNELKTNLNTCIDAVNSLVADATMLSEAAVQGILSTRADPDRHFGDFRKIVEGVNATLDAVIQPVEEGARVLGHMAKGDLTVRSESTCNGDLKTLLESINSVAGSLENAMRDVSEAVSATASASSQISSSTEEMAAGAQEQTSQAGEVASAVEQMTKTIFENSRNASLAAETAKMARESAHAGGRVVSETVAGMKRIADVVQLSAGMVRELGRSSDQIGEIIGVIDDIADQTNLLALNAAIEAARAGEQGRGFAVVADEVRKLAERTTKATKEIAGMIKKIQVDTAGAVTSMEEGTGEVQRGIALADKAGASLQEIVGVSQKVTDMVTQIAGASEQQSSTSEQIAKNVEAISKVTAETAQGTQQIARAAEDLNRLTENLQLLISRFHLTSGSWEQARMAGTRTVPGQI
jgi:methyl-accepting chemotaxis protein